MICKRSVVGLMDAGDPDATPDPIRPKLVERYYYGPYGTTVVEIWDPTANGGLGAFERPKVYYSDDGGDGGGDDGSSGDVPMASAHGNPYLWTGQRWDASERLYHFVLRTYCPGSGRWHQRDRIGYVDGVNLYEYVTSSPVVWYDPYGDQSHTGRGLALYIRQILEPVRKATAALSKVVDKYLTFKKRLTEAQRALDAAKKSCDAARIRKAQQALKKAQDAVRRARNEVNSKANEANSKLNAARKDLEGLGHGGNRVDKGLQGAQKKINEQLARARGQGTKGAKPPRKPGQQKVKRERNRGIDEEHSRVAKGSGGQGAKK